MKLAIGRNDVGRLLLGATVVLGTGLASMATVALPAAAAPGQTLLVSTTGSDLGTCVTAACRTLGYAISQASAHDTILLEPGVYPESQNPPGTENVVGTSLAGLKIASQSGDPSGTVIDATGARDGIVVNADDVTVQSLTIRGAGTEGILETPPANAVAPANVTDETVKDDIVEHDGGAVDLESTTDSTVTANTVEHDVAGILLSDDVGPSHGNVVSGNDVSYNTGIYNTGMNNAGGSGITLAGESSRAVAPSGAGPGQPEPAVAGVFDNRVSGNVSDHNGGAGFLVEATEEGSGAYDNSVKGNTAVGDAAAGVAIEGRASVEDANGNLVVGNTLSNDATHGGPGGSQGAFGGPPEAANLNQTAGIQILASLAPVTGTVVSGNAISNVYYGVWLSALATATAVSRNNISFRIGGKGVFQEPAPYSGYWMAAADGGAFAFGSAEFDGSAPGSVLGAPVVGVAPTPDRGGYWLAAANGQVVGLGDAVVYGTLKHHKLASPIVGIAAAPDGDGYWLVGSDGGVFGFGDAAFHGSVPGVLRPGQHLSAPIVGIASTPDGGGYWLVASDGGVFSFGNAEFFGSVPGALKPGARLSAPIVGVAASPGAIDLGSGRFSGDGYWLVASDGGVFSFGDAGYFGSVPGALKHGAHLSAPIVGIAASPGVLDASTSDFDSDGYWLAGADGGMFAFGQARYVGSVPGALKPGQHLAAPVVSIAGA
jgi:hypothetical protein